MNDTYAFEIISPKHGKFTVIAPVRFRREIDAKRWHINRGVSRGTVRFSVATNASGVPDRKLWLHRFVMELAGCAPMNIDHIDRSPLNNAEDNLRSGVIGNQRNVGLRRNNTSRVTGVYWHKKRGKWQAQIKVGRKLLGLGNFDSLEEAAKARDAKAKELHGQFAVLSRFSEPARKEFPEVRCG